jgi:hypothetical protein
MEKTMKPLQINVLGPLVLLATCAVVTQSAEPFELSAKVLTGQIPLGTVPVVEFTVKYKGQSEISYLKLGDFSGLSIKWHHTDKQKLIIKDAKSLVESNINQAGDYCSIAPTKSIRFLSIPSTELNKTGIISIKYTAIMQYYNGKPTPENQKYQEWDGQVEIVVVKDGGKADYISELLTIQKQTPSQSAAIASAISLVNHPSAISALLQIGRSNPYSVQAVSSALIPYLSSDEGREAMERLADEFPKSETMLMDGRLVSKEITYGYECLSAVLRSFQKTQAFPTQKFISKHLSSSNERKVWRMLEYILKADAQKQVEVEVLRKFLLSDNEEIRNFAQKIIEKKPVEKTAKGLDF